SVACMMEDAQVAVLLTQSHLVGELPRHAARVVLLDAAPETLAAFPSTNPVSGASPADLPHVFSTSAPAPPPPARGGGPCPVPRRRIRFPARPPPISPTSSTPPARPAARRA